LSSLPVPFVESIISTLQNEPAFLQSMAIYKLVNGDLEKLNENKEFNILVNQLFNQIESQISNLHNIILPGK
jgi:hypothetical protein